MYTLEQPQPDDIPVLVDMYQDLLTHAYPDRELASKLTLYKIVLSWFNDDDRIRVVIKDNMIVGFSLARFENAGGATEMVINADITYIYAPFRKTKAAFLLYNDLVDYAKRCNLIIMSTSTPESAPIVEKRWNTKTTFHHIETTITKS